VTGRNSSNEGWAATDVAIGSSLFGSPPAPALAEASEWVTGTLFGGLATGLCVIAVAFIGFRLMTGDMAIRDGLRVVLGCFVLLGAPFIALGLQGAAGQSAAPGQAVAATAALPEVPTPPYDPYLGASVRWDGFQAPPQPAGPPRQPD
jgi:type IV secretion system protein VirB2